MSAAKQPYRKILVAIDFSPHSEAALKQAVWLARRCGAALTLMHTSPDLRRVVHSAKVRAYLHQLYGDALQGDFQRESETKMRRLIADLNATDLNVSYRTVLGESFVEIIHAVHQAGHDLVLAGTRGLAAWEQFFIGSTSKTLIRKCPSSVWIVKAEHVGPPQVVVAATDFSEVSRKAVCEGLWVAQQASAEFHLLHVIDYLTDIPAEVVTKFPPSGPPLRQEINDEAQKRLEAFVASLDTDPAQVHLHLSWGTPWQEVDRLARHLNADVIAIGTVGRSGIKGVLMGNTAEKILATSECSLLTVKPADFVSPIAPVS